MVIATDKHLTNRLIKLPLPLLATTNLILILKNESIGRVKLTMHASPKEMIFLKIGKESGKELVALSVNEQNKIEYVQKKNFYQEGTSGWCNFIIIL